MIKVKFETESKSWKKQLAEQGSLMPSPGPLVGDTINIPIGYDYYKFKVEERAWIQEEIPGEDGLQWVLYIKVS